MKGVMGQDSERRFRPALRPPVNTETGTRLTFLFADTLPPNGSWNITLHYTSAFFGSHPISSPPIMPHTW